MIQSIIDLLPKRVWTQVHCGSVSIVLPLHMINPLLWSSSISKLPLLIQETSPNMPITSSASLLSPTLALKSPRSNSPIWLEHANIFVVVELVLLLCTVHVLVSSHMTLFVNGHCSCQASILYVSSPKGILSICYIFCYCCVVHLYSIADNSTWWQHRDTESL